MAMEFCGGGSINNMIQSFSSTPGCSPGLPHGMAVSLMQQVVSGLQYLHGQGVVHRDIKPHNILMTQEGVAKLADFGHARLNDPSKTTTQVPLCTQASRLTLGLFATGALFAKLLLHHSMPRAWEAL